MEKGDIVVLKSGSPQMTVVDFTIDTVVCNWFIGNEIHEAKFPMNSLLPFNKTKKVKQKVKNTNKSDNTSSNRKTF